jgi:putative tryptophan/tyrosine transport system substrate-binding protein
MRRREFIALGAGAAVIPVVALAQQPKVITTGVLVHSAPGWQRFWQVFPAALSARGYVEGRNIRFEFRSDEGDLSRLPELAAELVSLKVDVIVTWFTPTAIAAKQATRDIPIVCALCGDMIGTGLAESLARPGGNVTGNTGLTAETSAKIVELIRELVPATHRIAVLANAPDPFSKSFLKEMQLAGEATKTVLAPVMIQRPEELDAAFSAMVRERPDAIIVQPSLPTKRVAELALAHRIPAVCALRDFADEGGLMAYSSVELDMYRHAAELVDKILAGAKPADLPIEQPTRFELIINLKTAKALGLTLPQSLLLRAGEVIE